MNPILREEGGLTYFWIMMPMWCAMLAMSLCATALQILAFQPPSASSANLRHSTQGTARFSMSSYFLNDVSKIVSARFPTRDTCVNGRSHGGGSRVSSSGAKVGPEHEPCQQQLVTEKYAMKVASTIKTLHDKTDDDFRNSGMSAVRNPLESEYATFACFHALALMPLPYS